MTGLTPNLPPRDVTPQERARSARTFGLILLGFVAVVGAAVAFLSLGGRQVRDYGQAVYAAALKSAPSANTSYDLPCTRVLERPAPQAVQSCTVQVRTGEVTVVLSAGAGREYRVPVKR